MSSDNNMPMVYDPLEGSIPICGYCSRPLEDNSNALDRTGPAQKTSLSFEDLLADVVTDDFIIKRFSNGNIKLIRREVI